MLLVSPNCVVLHHMTPCFGQALTTAEAERAGLALRHKRALADQREAAAAAAAHERNSAEAREAEAAAELAQAIDDAARLRAELDEHREVQERAAAQARREHETEARMQHRHTIWCPGTVSSRL